MKLNISFFLSTSFFLSSFFFLVVSQKHRTLVSDRPNMKGNFICCYIYIYVNGCNHLKKMCVSGDNIIMHNLFYKLIYKSCAIKFIYLVDDWNERKINTFFCLMPCRIGIGWNFFRNLEFGWKSFENVTFHQLKRSRSVIINVPMVSMDSWNVERTHIWWDDQRKFGNFERFVLCLSIS